MKLTKKEIKIIHAACELLALKKERYSCAAIETAFDPNNKNPSFYPLVERYCDFYCKETGTFWISAIEYKKYTETEWNEFSNGWRQTLLLWFAKCASDI